MTFNQVVSGSSPEWLRERKKREYDKYSLFFLSLSHSVSRKPERFTVEGENCAAILVVHHMLFVVD